jgi:hypothetical protein
MSRLIGSLCFFVAMAAVPPTPAGADSISWMYWTDRAADTISRAHLDVSQIEDLVTIDPPPGVDSAPHGAALDTQRGHMYWVDNGTVKIQRANLDGTNVVDLLTGENSDLMRPWQIVLDLSDDVELTPLQAGDANQDLSFDQTDFIQVLQAGKYLTGQAASWGQGDWNGAPGGSPGNPPLGDGTFNQADVIAALSSGLYLTGPYGALGSRGGIGQPRDSTTSAAVAGGIVPRDAEVDDGTTFTAAFNAEYGSLAAKTVSSPTFFESFMSEGVAMSRLVADVGGFGPVNPILAPVPEPSSLLLILIALVTLRFPGWRQLLLS